jgi:putative hydroxymethylpyrimidine transporter CytX
MTKNAIFLWFGAAISISEILAGTYAAELGFMQGATAILTGHIIGCLLLFLAGFIGARSGVGSMETAKFSFGSRGGLLFSVLNILQLFGWICVMIYNATVALSDSNNAFIPLLLGAFVVVWIVTFRNSSIINNVAVILLLIVCIFITLQIFVVGNYAPIANESGATFGSIVELSIAMPLSWIPLIADYTKFGKTKPLKVSVASAIAYFFASSWMYIIGFGAVLFLGVFDIHGIVNVLGFIGLVVFVILFSTVTTVFLDSFSAGESFAVLNKKLHPYSKHFAVFVTISASIVAIFMTDHFSTIYQNFLYLIGAVFSPMIAVMLVDYFVLRRNYSTVHFGKRNLVAWLLGFIYYEVLLNLQVDFILGITSTTVVLTAVLTWIFAVVFTEKEIK